jgi:hypothetical protein
MKATWAKMTGKTLMIMLAAAGFAAFAAVPVKANHGSFSLSIGAQRGGVWVPPVYERRPRTITTPPVYEDVVRQVWNEPVYETRRFPVEIPAKVVTRKAPRYNHYGQIIGWELITEIVEPARTEWRTERVCVREGYYSTVSERVLVRPAEARVIWEQVVVRPGYWEAPSRLVIGKGRPFPHPVAYGLDRSAELHVGFRH